MSPGPSKGNATRGDPSSDGKLDLLLSHYDVEAGTQTQTFYGDGAGHFSTTPP